MSRLWLVPARLCMLAALAASSALYIQYLNPVASTFCGPDSGCEAVRRSGFSYLGTPVLSLPLLGLVGFGIVFYLSLQAPRSRTLILLVQAGAAVAAALLLAQAFLVQAFCWLCVAVDVSALLIALFTILSVRGEDEGDAGEPLAPWSWWGLAALAAVAPPVWSFVKPAPPVPPVIQALYEPGKINVVEFADFECPFCRALHPVLKAELAQYPADRVHFVRMNVPLDQHVNAEPAAIAYICADQQGKGEPMADALVASDFDQPLRRLAVALGLDMKAYDACVQSPLPGQRIDHEIAVLREAGMQGLPTTYIGGTRLVGMVEPVTLRDAIERAARGDSEGGVPGPLFAGLVALVAAALAWFGRRPRATLTHGVST